MRIIDWSSDVCSSDLRLDHHVEGGQPFGGGVGFHPQARIAECAHLFRFTWRAEARQLAGSQPLRIPISESRALSNSRRLVIPSAQRAIRRPPRSEEHTSELQSLMRTSSAVSCLKQKTKAAVAED